MKLVLKSGKLERIMGLKIPHDLFKPIDSLEWRSAIAFVR
jgi:hypothetical protein